MPTLRRLLALAAFPLAFTFTHANAASFDCGLATQTAEHVICGSTELSSLDERLHVAYSKHAQTNQNDVDKLLSAQHNWLMHRNACAYSFDCIKASMLSRIEQLSPSDLAAYSWGGKLRDQPSLNSIQVGSTREKQQIHVIAKTSQEMNGYPWFKVEVNGKQSYQWGGLICAPAYPTTSHCG